MRPSTRWPTMNSSPRNDAQGRCHALWRDRPAWRRSTRGSRLRQYPMSRGRHVPDSPTTPADSQPVSRLTIRTTMGRFPVPTDRIGSAGRAASRSASKTTVLGAVPASGAGQVASARPVRRPYRGGAEIVRREPLDEPPHMGFAHATDDRTSLPCPDSGARPARHEMQKRIQRAGK